MAHPMQHYGERNPKPPTKITLYQIDPKLAPDDPMQELVKQWIGTVLLPVEPPNEVGTYRLKASRRSVDDPWEYEWAREHIGYEWEDTP